MKHKVGDEVLVKGKIYEIDHRDSERPYRVLFNGGAIHWNHVDDIVEPAKKVKVPVWFDEWYHDNDVADSNDMDCIQILSDSDAKLWISGNKIEDKDRLRFIGAIVYGYEVETEKRFLLPMEGTEQSGSYRQYATVSSSGEWRVNGYVCDGEANQNKDLYVTQSQLDSAPAWVKAIKPVEVSKLRVGVD